MVTQEKRVREFEYRIENGEVTIVKYTGDAADVAVPSVIEGLPVAEIGPEAFAENSFAVERIVVPGSVRRIGAGAFKMCMSLTELVLQEGLEILGEGCLYVAPLRELFFPSTLREVCRPQELGVFPWRIDPANPYYYTDGYALYHRTEEGIELAAVQREDRRKEYRVLKDFPEGAFAGQHRLECLTHPGNKDNGGCSAVSAGNQRIAEGEDEKSADPGGLCPVGRKDETVSIGPGSFEGHMYLERVILPGSAEVIGDDAFSSCQALHEVILPEGVQKIGADAFSYCFNLKDIHLPASLRVLGSRALTNTFGWSAPVNGIEEITVSKKNPVFRADKSALFEKIPQEEETASCRGAGRDVTSSGCTGRPARGKNLSGTSGEILLKYFGNEREYFIPDTVTEIGFSAFRRCGCHGIRIPASVQTVGEKAFLECDSLEWMYIGAEDVTICIPQTPVYRKSEPASLMHGTAASGKAMAEQDQSPAATAYDYPGYDRLFDTYFYLPDKCRMAVCRLTQPIALGEEQKAVYQNYLRENLTGILTEIHKTGDMALLAALADLGLFTETNIEACIETVTAFHDAKLVGFLLEYRHDRVPADEFDFTL